MVPLKRHKDPYLYLISTVIYTGARVAKPGQRRQVQGLVSQEFLGSNPIPRTFLMGYSYLTNCHPSLMISYF